MHKQIEEFYNMHMMYLEARDKLMDILTDEDLTFRLSDNSPTLGQLCVEMGETHHTYIESFKTFKIDFSYRTDNANLATDVALLKGWYQLLDTDLNSVLESISDDDVENRKVDRDGFELPPHIHLDVLREALLIFYGKVSVYLKEMGKELPDLWKLWIG